MTGIELMHDPAKRQSFDPADRIGHHVIKAARRRGVIIRPLGDILILMPPLSITEGEIYRLVAVTRDSIREVLGA